MFDIVRSHPNSQPIFRTLFPSRSFCAGTQGRHCQGACHPQWLFCVANCDLIHENTQSPMLRARFYNKYCMSALSGLTTPLKLNFDKMCTSALVICGLLLANKELVTAIIE